MSERTATGRWRYRVLSRLGRKPVLVLQLEVAREHTSYFQGYIDTWREVWWEDARPEDMPVPASLT